MEVRDITDHVRGQQGQRKGASWEHPAGAKRRRLLRAVRSKYIAKPNKHRARTVWSVLQLRGPGNHWSKRKKGGKIHPAKICVCGGVFKSFILICLYYAYHMVFTFLKKKYALGLVSGIQ